MALDTNWSNRLTADLMNDFSLSLEQAQGAVGSLAMESKGFTDWQEDNPVVPGSRGGAGMAQWTGPRRVAFERYAAEVGLDPNSYEAQYGYLTEELQGVGGHDKNVIKKLQNATTAEEATRIFTSTFLRPGIVHMAARLNWTGQVADNYVKLPPGMVNGNKVASKLDVLDMSPKAVKKRHNEVLLARDVTPASRAQRDVAMAKLVYPRADTVRLPTLKPPSNIARVDTGPLSVGFFEQNLKATSASDLVRAGGKKQPDAQVVLPTTQRMVSASDKVRATQTPEATGQSSLSISDKARAAALPTTPASMKVLGASDRVRANQTPTSSLPSLPAAISASDLTRSAQNVPKMAAGSSVPSIESQGKTNASAKNPTVQAAAGTATQPSASDRARAAGGKAKSAEIARRVNEALDVNLPAAAAAAIVAPKVESVKDVAKDADAKAVGKTPALTNPVVTQTSVTPKKQTQTTEIANIQQAVATVGRESPNDIVHTSYGNERTRQENDSLAASRASGKFDISGGTLLRDQDVNHAASVGQALGISGETGKKEKPSIQEALGDMFSGWIGIGADNKKMTGVPRSTEKRTPVGSAGDGRAWGSALDSVTGKDLVDRVSGKSGLSSYDGAAKSLVQ